MQIIIDVPIKAQIITNGFVVTVDSGGSSWKKSQLGDYANRSGVYIHHSNGKILYIGKTTTGEFGHFGERLRRELKY